MKKLLLKSVVGLSPLLSFAPAYASFYDEVDGKFDLGHHIAENATGFLPIPILITEPALGYGGGIAGLILHETPEEKRQRKKAALEAVDGGAQLMPSAISIVGAAGSANGSWFAFGGHQHSWLDDKIRYLGGGGAGVVNLDIYQDISIPGFETPIGDFPGFNKELSFATKTSAAAMLQKVQFRVGETALMLGVKQVLAISKVESDNKVVDKVFEFALGDKSITSGLGLYLDYDKRNSFFYPTQGYRLQAETMVYDEKIGSDSNYSNTSYKGEGYVPLSRKWNLGFAGSYQKFSTDDVFVSPTTKPYIDLRGIAAYRYQGDEVATLQSQLSYNIDNRWVVSAFYGAGEAQNHYDNGEGYIDAYGVGFRYQIARRYGLHLGLDLAKSNDDGAIYVNIGTGF